MYNDVAQFMISSLAFASVEAGGHDRLTKRHLEGVAADVSKW